MDLEPNSYHSSKKTQLQSPNPNNRALAIRALTKGIPQFMEIATSLKRQGPRLHLMAMIDVWPMHAHPEPPMPIPNWIQTQTLPQKGPKYAKTAYVGFPY